MKSKYKFTLVAIIVLFGFVHQLDQRKYNQKKTVIQSLEIIRSEHADFEEIKRKLDQFKPQLEELKVALANIENDREKVISNGGVPSKENVYHEIKSGLENLSREYDEKSDIYYEGLNRIQQRYGELIETYNNFSSPIIFKRNKLPNTIDFNYIPGMKPNKAL